MIDKTLDSLDFTDWIWGFQLNLSSIIIPKNLVAATRGNATYDNFDLLRGQSHVIKVTQR